MTITDLIVEHRIELDDINVSGMPVTEMATFRGELIQRMVDQWLSQTPSIEIVTDVENHSSYDLAWRDRNLTVSNGRTLCEYDFVVSHTDTLWFCEVKSLKLNGFTKKIPRDLRYAREITGQETGMLVFLPFYTSKSADRRTMEENSGVHCVDLGYKKKQFRRFEANLFRR